MGIGWLPEMGGQDDGGEEQGRARDGEEPLAEEWGLWLASSLGDLRDRRLLRVQRPTIALKSSTRALVPDAQLADWAAGIEPQGVVARYAGPASARSGSSAASAAAAPRHGVSELTLFSTNDYLGLGSHPEVCAAAADAALRLGMGPRSSAVVGGTTTLHRELEEALADLKGTEDCLLFPTGFAANMAVVASLCESGGCDVFSDELNHASIVDGARLAMRGGGGASAGPNRLHVYRHNDMAHLEQLLLAATDSADSAQPAANSASSVSIASSAARGQQRGSGGSGSSAGAAGGQRQQQQQRSRHRRRLVVTDSLFSMDGDFAELRALAALRARHGFMLVVDEAHATLVCGDTGAGAASAAGMSHCVDVHVGTLSKAAGALGGFVACTLDMKALLLNKGRSYVYSTALPLPVVAAALTALRVSAREPWRRAHVWALAARLGRALGVPALSPVVPLVLGGEVEALAAAGALLTQHHMHVPAIRPPTVPQGTCRLRVSLSAGHSIADVDALAAAVSGLGLTLAALPSLVRQAEERRRPGAWSPEVGVGYGSRL
ncbi:hypothetical protein FOA52_004598 [Chlamydomonas sp. UWO 241]|nr:hypothetical protein FOA52_004598 [Chlamydomonas sp. UWO 241]